MSGQPVGGAGQTPEAAERSRRREVLLRAGVFLVTEETLSGGRKSEEIVQAALADGVRAIQVREKRGSARRALEIARAVRGLTRRFGALLIVDDRIDIAVAVEADGVHLGQDDLPLAEARRLLGQAPLIGLSITDAAQLTAADAHMADYLGVGAIFPTASKADASPAGLALLGSARRMVDASTGAASRMPIVAIGGITLQNAGMAISAGADVVAVISAIAGARDAGRAASELLAAVRAAGSPR
jgi:thiamine-phosphate pyrophosphorylase